MRSAQATITKRARLRVAVVERSTPKRRATTAVSSWLIPSVTGRDKPEDYAGQHRAGNLTCRERPGWLSRRGAQPRTLILRRGPYPPSRVSARPAAPAAPATLAISVPLVVRCGIQLTAFLNPSLSR